MSSQQKTTKKCPHCAEEILADAKKCKHCGEFLEGSVREQKQTSETRTPTYGVAAVLSLVIPGAGQMYKGQIGGGFAWLIAVIIGYGVMIIPGIVLHICCVLNAASRENPQIQKASTITFPERTKWDVWLWGAGIFIVMLCIIWIFGQP